MSRHCLLLLLLLAACSLAASVTALPTAAEGASASTAGAAAKPQADDSIGKHGLTAKQAVKVAIAALETVNSADVIAGVLAAETRPGMRNAQHKSVSLPSPHVLPAPAPSVVQPTKNTMGMSVQRIRSNKIENVDACLRYPCISNEHSSAVCKDKAGDAPDSPDGRTCTCVVPNHIYQGELLGCLDVDACKKHPCAKGDAPAVCKDLPGSAPDSIEGRTCTCPPGFVYINDISGCVDIFACIENEWSELCTHPCKEAPQLNHGSFSGKCSGADVGKNTVCPGHCDQGWTLGQQQPTARCTSAGWVVEGSCKVAPQPLYAKMEGVTSRPRFSDPNFFAEHDSDDYLESIPPAKHGDKPSAHHTYRGEQPAHHGEHPTRDAHVQPHKQPKADRVKERRHRRKGKRRHRDIEESLDLLLAADPRLQQWLVDKRASTEDAAQVDDAREGSVTDSTQQQQQQRQDPREEPRQLHRDPPSPKVEDPVDPDEQEREEDRRVERRQQQKEEPAVKQEPKKTSTETKPVQEKERTEQPQEERTVRKEHKGTQQDQKAPAKEDKAKQQVELPDKKDQKAPHAHKSTEQKQEGPTHKQDKHLAANEGEEINEPQQQQQQQQEPEQNAPKHSHKQKQQQHPAESPEKHEKPQHRQHQHHQQEQQHGHAHKPEHITKHAAPHPQPAPGDSSSSSRSSDSSSSGDNKADDMDEIEYVYEEEEVEEVEAPVPAVKETKPLKQAQQARESEQEVLGDSQEDEETQKPVSKPRNKDSGSTGSSSTGSSSSSSSSSSSGSSGGSSKAVRKDDTNKPPAKNAGAAAPAPSKQQQLTPGKPVAADQDKPRKTAADNKQASDAPKQQPAKSKQQEPEQELEQRPQKKKKPKQVDTPATEPEPAQEPSDSTAAKAKSPPEQQQQQLKPAKDTGSQQQQQQQQQLQEDNKKKQKVQETEEKQNFEEEDAEEEEEVEDEGAEEADEDQQQQQQQQQRAKPPAASPPKPAESDSNPRSNSASSNPKPQQQQQQQQDDDADADAEADIEYEEEEDGEVQGEDDDEVTTTHSRLHHQAAVPAKITRSQRAPAGPHPDANWPAPAAAEKPTIQHQQKMLLHGHLRRQQGPQQQQTQQQAEQQLQQTQQQPPQQAAQQATQDLATMPHPIPLRRRFKGSYASSMTATPTQAAPSPHTPPHLKAPAAAAAAAAPTEAPVADSALAAPPHQQQQQQQQQQLLMKHTQDFLMLPLMQQDQAQQQQQQQQKPVVSDSPVRVIEDAHPDEDTPRLLRRKPAAQQKQLQLQQEQQQQQRAAQDQYGVLRKEMVEGLVQMPATATMPVLGTGNSLADLPQLQQRRRPHIAPAIKQVASARSALPANEAGARIRGGLDSNAATDTAPGRRPMVGGKTLLTEALEAVEEEVDGGRVLERPDVIEAQVAVAAVAPANAPAAAATPVAKPRKRSLLSSEFFGGLFSVPTDSGSAVKTATAEQQPKGTFKLEDFPDLGRLNNMLDSLEGSVETRHHMPHPAPAAAPLGSHLRSRTLAAQPLRVKDSVALPHDGVTEASLEDLSLLGLDEIAAEMLTNQPIKRHKQHQEPEQDPLQGTADRQHREYAGPTPKPHKQYDQPEFEQYEQQYSPRSPEQYIEKLWSPKVPEQQQQQPYSHAPKPAGPAPYSDPEPSYEPSHSPDSSMDYKPKRLNRPWRNTGDASHHRDSASHDPSYGGNGQQPKPDKHAYEPDTYNPEASNPSKGAQRQKQDLDQEHRSGPDAYDQDNYRGHSGIKDSDSKSSYSAPDAADGLASKAHELMSKASQALKGRQQQQKGDGGLEKLSKELDELSKELEAIKALDGNPGDRHSGKTSDRPSERPSDRAPVRPHRPQEDSSMAERPSEAPHRIKVPHFEAMDAPPRSLPPSRHSPGTSGPALVFFTNTAREKAGSVTVCQWVNGRLGECYITMIPMFKVNGKNSYPQPTGIAVQQDSTGRTRVWIVDGTRNPAVTCTLVGLQVVGCEERRYRGYSDGLFDARQIAVAGNVAFILAWDKACVVQCLDAKGLSQCSCILGQEHHGIFPAGLTVSGNKLYVAHNKGSNAGVMTCDFGPQGVNECIRSPDLPLNVDGGMLVHEGHMYLSYTDYNEPDLSARGGIIICDDADHIRLNTCRYSTGKIPARGGIFGLAVHDGIMFVPQHVKSQEVSICSEVTDTDVARCKSVFTKDADDRVAFRAPCAVAVLPVEGEMPQPPKAFDEPTSKIDLLKNY